MILRLLNPQGIAGLAASVLLAVLLVIQKGETRHWKNESASFEQRFRQEQTDFVATMANYRAAADQARAADAAKTARVAAEQRDINERTSHDFEARLAAAHAAAQRLRLQPETAADPRIGRDAPVPRLSAASLEPAEAAGQDGLPQDERLIATEQAIQLDELIKWVRAQAAVDPNATTR
jgi:hypothetical protein